MLLITIATDTMQTFSSRCTNGNVITLLEQLCTRDCLMNFVFKCSEKAFATHRRCLQHNSGHKMQNLTVISTINK